MRFLKSLEGEVHRWKQFVAGLSLDKAMLQDALGNKALKSVQQRELAGHAQCAYDVSERRAGSTSCMARSTNRLRGLAAEQVSQRMRIREIAESRLNWGYPGIWGQLRREGWAVNRMRVCRLYRAEGLHRKRQKPRRHRSISTRILSSRATRANESWLTDFMADELFDGRRFRLLEISSNCVDEAFA